MYKVEIAAMDMCNINDVMVVENLSFTIPWSRSAFVDEVSSNKFAIYIVAKIDGNVVGYAGMWKVCDEGHITNIAVHPEFRQNGVGSMLVEGLIKIAKHEGIDRMTLEVRSSNYAAQKLYAKYDFKTAGVRKAYYSDNGEDALIMWKDKV